MSWIVTSRLLACCPLRRLHSQVSFLLTRGKGMFMKQLSRLFTDIGWPLDIYKWGKGLQPSPHWDWSLFGCLCDLHFFFFSFGLRRGFVIRPWERRKLRRQHLVPYLPLDLRSSFWFSVKNRITVEGEISAAQFWSIKGVIALKCFQEATTVQDRTASHREGMINPKAIVSFLNTVWRLPELLGFLGQRGRVMCVTVPIDLAPHFVEGVSNVLCG